MTGLRDTGPRRISDKGTLRADAPWLWAAEPFNATLHTEDEVWCRMIGTSWLREGDTDACAITNVPTPARPVQGGICLNSTLIDKYDIPGAGLNVFANSDMHCVCVICSKRQFLV